MGKSGNEVVFLPKLIWNNVQLYCPLSLTMLSCCHSNLEEVFENISRLTLFLRLMDVAWSLRREPCGSRFGHQRARRGPARRPAEGLGRYAAEHGSVRAWEGACRLVGVRVGGKPRLSLCSSSSGSSHFLRVHFPRIQ